MEQIVKEYLAVAEKSANEMIEIFNGLQLVDSTEKDLENLDISLARLQNTALERMAQNGVTPELLSNLNKNDYPKLLQFLRAKKIQNLLPIKVD
jgi:hypothetical protein